MVKPEPVERLIHRSASRSFKMLAIPPRLAATYPSPKEVAEHNAQ